MLHPVPTELILIRHAPVQSDGCAYGRRDVSADLSDLHHLEFVRARCPAPDHVLHSPARRCVQTLHALWPGRDGAALEALWEQDLGAWEGVPYAQLPDLGPMSREALARHKPDSGESFADLCARVAPALDHVHQDNVYQGRTLAIVAHAGTIRAALAWAMGGVPAALAFDIAPLSLTRIAVLQDGTCIIRSVNEIPAEQRASG